MFANDRAAFLVAVNFFISMRSRLSRVALLAATCLTLMPASAPRAQQKVTYLLPAPTYLPAFGPWVVAQTRGYYATEGVDPTFQSAKGGADVAKQVGAGNAEIGGAMGDTPIIVRSFGVPVRAVAVLGGKGLMQLVVKADAGIAGPADLRGRTVAVTAFQETTFYATLGMLAAVGLSQKEVDIQAVGPANIWKLFLAGKADAMAGVPDFIADAESQGARLRIIPSSDYFHSMGQAIVASDRMIKERPEMIGALVRGTLRGMAAIIEDPAAAAVDYVKGVPERAGQERQVQRVFELYKTYVYGNQARLGEMNATQLGELQDFYVRQGIAQTAVPLDELYTNQFIR